MANCAGAQFGLRESTDTVVVERDMPQQKTYWHLQEQRRMPTEYEIVTSKLLCYTGEGFTGKRFELDVPLKDWYRQYQEESPLVCSSWEKFRDPRETTYTKYTELQRDKEIFVDAILEEIELTGYDARLRPAWLHLFPRVIAPFRYPAHGFQMIASYIGQMAPSGRITIAAALQSADEMRRIQRIAYRIRQLRQLYPGFAAESRILWQTDAMWQPLREAVERLLIAYDWAEAFVGLNLVLKPLIDELFMTHVGDLALGEEDYLLGQIFYSLKEDCQWHREWSAALVQTVIEDNICNRHTIQHWINQWHPLADLAVQAFALLLQDTLDQIATTPPKRIKEAIDRFYRDYLRSMSLEGPANDNRNPIGQNG
jgi:toluene monooxygenase system protein E